MIIYLNVPPEDQDKVENLGAIWNPTKKQWYVITDDIDHILLQNYLTHFEANVVFNDIDRFKSKDDDICFICGRYCSCAIQGSHRYENYNGIQGTFVGAEYGDVDMIYCCDDCFENYEDVIDFCNCGYQDSTRCIYFKEKGYFFIDSWVNIVQMQPSKLA